MTKTPSADFEQFWAERTFDRVQIAQVEAIKEALTDYAQNAWRKVDQVDPPRNELLTTACPNAGLQLLRLAENGEDWRTKNGEPSKAPQYWMPAPVLPAMQRE